LVLELLTPWPSPFSEFSLFRWLHFLAETNAGEHAAAIASSSGLAMILVRQQHVVTSAIIIFVELFNDLIEFSWLWILFSEMGTLASFA